MKFVIAALSAAVVLLAADWPQLLGPSRNGIAADVRGTPNLSSARQLWKKPIGAGFSGPAVASGRLIVFHRQNDREIVESLDPKTGARQWVFEYATAYRDDFGFDEGPRAVPTVSGGRVFTFGAEGVLHGLDLATGRKLWRVDTASKFGVRKGFFGAAASPLVEGSTVYLNVGGQKGSGLAAFDAATGEVRWTAGDDDAGYSSPVAATLDGVRSILFFTREGLVAADPAKGSIRFRFPWRSRTNASVNAALPVVSGNRVFLSSSYNTGAALLDVAGDKVTRLWSGDESLSAHYATPVLRDGYLYGFHGRQEFGQAFRCVEFATGKVMWSQDGFGAGSVILAGTRLVIVKESGEAVIAAADPKGFRVESKAQLLPGVVRAYPALADGVLYLRNENTLAAWSVIPAGAGSR